MLVTTAGRYALRALIDLAVYGNGRPTRIKDISRRQRISSRYLEQIFSKLFKAGLIRGRRGPFGGYVLAKDASQISVADIISAAEGPLQPVPVACLSENGSHNDSCDLFEGCLSRHVWKETQRILLDYLNSVTIADLCALAGRHPDPAIPRPLASHTSVQTGES
ncbi:MAG: RrF2 family transcriptional regulator [Desulfomonile tiedjei]|uniref:RrF2 family transcriptional regulator n=1 Tax=Desulfomonile tiedjei TaxID=2358 RepID=A0A9D6Z2F1_9BACT|nr:RrF2 family transcriptional regulator [Desulfomonile tiedjei]